MVSVTLATSEWIQFFTDAGIPPGPAVNYAISFVDNRIQKNMLMDLTKDIVHELGITVVGDIIAILKHAKLELAKEATESIGSNQSNLQVELKRAANSPASRMIANSLRRDSPPSTPARRPETSTSKISVTVANKLATKKAVLPRPADPSPDGPAKRRRVTAEMEGKYIINMPKGITAKTQRILQQQATQAQALPRMSVFNRLGAETKADTTTGSKLTGVFSRLGEVVSEKKESSGGEDEEEEEEEEEEERGAVLQYAGVLKRKNGHSRKEAPKAPAPKAKPPPAVTSIRRMSVPKAVRERTPRGFAEIAAKPPPAAVRLGSAAGAKVSLRQRLGQPGRAETDTQDNQVTSTKGKAPPEFTVTIKNNSRQRVVPGVIASSSTGSEARAAQMDTTGTVSVFERLGRKMK
ncbi:uncharacterized protein C19orf47 homolog isoform X2 [Callorhinchus milii]|uniref:uncharacterized protein C19orf47 homolog isoform X2 n=1 Tax=Callorhinchus milii TaxID=7868 RepID=UPI001C3FE890|nr:uncharacterized protein C19orf47 homolog isoform X2 [Callorhinchus milii]